MKFKALLIVILLISILSVSGTVLAMTEQEKQTIIAELQAEIQSLIQRIIQLQQQTSTTPSPQTTPQDWCYTFNTNLGFSNSGSSDVGQLHTALTKQGISFSPDTGNTYSNATALAVSVFQERYASEILRAHGLTKGTGFFGNSTRAKLNQLYGCRAQTNETEDTDNETIVCAQDARQCADGSWVSRVPPSCNFASCPVETETNQTSQTNIPETQNLCIPDWECTAWTDCHDGKQYRSCWDKNICRTTNNLPTERECTTKACVPMWSCDSWSACSNGSQQRNCTDTNYCDVGNFEKRETQSCVSGNSTDPDDPFELPTITPRPSCITYWKCTDWTPCSSSGTQTRSCYDLNECPTPSSDKPQLTRTGCTPPKTSTGTSTGTSSDTGTGDKETSKSQVWKTMCTAIGGNYGIGTIRPCTCTRDSDKEGWLCTFDNPPEESN